MTLNTQIQPIAHISTPYKQKFAIPRQPGLVREARGIIRFTSEFNDVNCIRGLEQFSHLWLIFQFHQNQGWSPLVRPPRLGGNNKQGVFATRSSFRPNGLGMSVVELQQCVTTPQGPEVIVTGIDLLDNTPIIDIKPYIPYADSLPDAHGGFAVQAPAQQLEVMFSEVALDQLRQATEPDLKPLIIGVLQQDPRPAYKRHKADKKIYAMNLYHYNIRFQICQEICTVIEIDAEK